MSELQQYAPPVETDDTILNTYFDNQRITEVTEWEDARILAMSHDYARYVSREDVSPRAMLLAKRVLTHLGFEWGERLKEKEDMEQML